MRLGRSSLPRDVAARVHGRPLAFAETTDGSWLVATRDALYVVDAGESAVIGTRIPWEQVEGADWDRDGSRLRVTEIGRFGEPRPSYVFTLPDLEPASLLQLIRERVTASVVLQRGQVVTGKRGLKVIGRRSPSGGPITWMHEYDEGVDPDDPAVAEAAETLLQQARADVGE
jgi:dipeptidyl aminopeptidase/acylaminoacyl peptidase